jgi:hypothetical protein
MMPCSTTTGSRLDVHERNQTGLVSFQVADPALHRYGVLPRGVAPSVTMQCSIRIRAHFLFSRPVWPDVHVTAKEAKSSLESCVPVRDEAPMHEAVRVPDPPPVRLGVDVRKS